MKVFVTGTGRCGSVCFREACRHITNYTCGHETPCGLLHYPDQHIEINPQLRRCIHITAERNPGSKWVHLKREGKTCIPSLARLDNGGVMRAYAHLRPTTVPSMQPLDIAEAYYRDEIRSIDADLKVAKVEWQVMQLESIKDGWLHFWKWIGAEGDFEASLREWDTPRNTAAERGEIKP